MHPTKITIDTSVHTDYSTGSDYLVIIEGATVDGGNITAAIFTFSIENRFAEVDVTKIGGDAQSATDLKDFADAGYDPATNKVQGVVLCDTLTTYTGNTVQTGDSYARIGAAGASLTDLGGMSTGMKAEVESEANDALVALNLDHLLAVAVTTEVVDNSVIAKMVSDQSTAAWSDYANTDDSLMQISDKLDANNALIGDVSDALVAATSAVDDPGAAATTTQFNTDLTQVDDFWNDALITFTSGALSGQSRTIVDYANTNGAVTLDEALTSAPADNVAFTLVRSHIHPKSQIATSVWAEATRTLTAATNITSDASAINATSGVVDTVNLVNTTTTNTDMLTAAAVNAEVDTALTDFWTSPVFGEPRHNDGIRCE